MVNFLNIRGDVVIMVNFLNITIDGDYIYAIAEDCDNKTRKKIKVHKNKSEYFIEGGNDSASSNLIKALWCLQSEIEENKNNIGENITIAWG